MFSHLLFSLTCRDWSEHDFSAWSRNLAAASLGRHKCSCLPPVCPLRAMFITESRDVGTLNVKKHFVWHTLLSHTYCSYYEMFSDQAPMLQTNCNIVMGTENAFFLNPQSVKWFCVQRKANHLFTGVSSSSVLGFLYWTSLTLLAVIKTLPCLL